MKTQLRGNCQACARECAVNAAGLITNHGYGRKAKVGAVSEVCRGAGYRPLQVERVFLDQVCADLRFEASLCDKSAADLMANRVDPKVVFLRRIDGRMVEQEIAYSEATAMAKDIARQRAISDAHNRLNGLRAEASLLERHADWMHGEPLIEKTPTKLKPISVGDRKQISRFAAVATKVEKGRVYWRSLNGQASSWTGAAAWRRLPNVPKAEG